MNDYKILIKFPTRGRPEKFFNVLEKYYSKAKDKKNLAFLISCDEDDITMNNSNIINKLEEFKKKVKLIYFFGKSETKVQAINADINKCNGWDIILLASDDMIPIVDGYDDIIRNDMNINFPDLDGVLWYSDGARTDIDTLSILGKKYYDRFKYLYHPEYISLWCDNEFTNVFLQLKKYYKSEKVIIEHQHPVYEKCNYDDLYIRNESYFNHDKKTYEKRKLLNFDIDYIPPKLSILTLSVPSRVNTTLLKLINKIQTQINNNGFDKIVEHLILIDNKLRTIGTKRNDLLNIANGDFIAFLDDDDDISDDYLLEIINAINKNSDVDVITFKQNCFIEDYPKATAIFGLNNENEDYVPNTTFKRKPYHMCVWNKKLAKKYKCPATNYGEDYAWITNMCKEAKTETHIDKILHAYIHSNNKSEANLMAKIKNQI